MKTQFVLLVALAAMLPLPSLAHAQSRHKAHPTAAVAVYECSICHHKASAVQAKKLHYICPADGGKLVRIKMASFRKPR